MQKAILMMLLIAAIIPAAYAATNTTATVCATPAQVSNIQKIVDDMDRRTDAIVNSMATKVDVHDEAKSILNKTATKEDIDRMNAEFTAFKQEQNFKMFTFKIEAVFLFMAMTGILFIFQKFWEFGQAFFDRILTMIETNKKDAMIAQLKDYETNLDKSNKELVKLRKLKTPKGWDRLFGGDKHGK